ncbi:MAG: LptF/LptG family permease [Planctomycetota bacterium]
MSGRLDRYVAGYFLSSYAVAFFFFVGLFIVIDLVSRIDDFLETARGSQISSSQLASLVLEYYILYIPTIFLQVAPFITLIGAVVTVIRLLRTNELIPMIMAGRSVFRVLLPVFMLALAITAGMILVQEKLSPGLADRRAAAIAFLKEGVHGLVIHPPLMADAQGRVWRFDGGYHLAKKQGMGVTAKWKEGNDLVVVWARAMVHDPERRGWNLIEGRLQHAPPGESALSSPQEITFIAGGPTPDQISVGEKSAYELSLSQIAELCRLHPQQLKWRVLLHCHITFPLGNLLLVLLGVPFVLRHEHRGYFVGLAKGLLVCVLYFTADFAMRGLGAKGEVNPVIAAWLPTIVFGSAGICLFDAMRT